MDDRITHEGQVLEIRNDIIKVSIIQNSACAECHAKAACNLSDTKEKIIEVPNAYVSLKTGDKVQVEASVSLGYKAVIYAFLIPVILILLSLFIVLHIQSDETIAGLLALAVLVVYYFILYLFRDKIRKKFVFTLVKD